MSLLNCPGEATRQFGVFLQGCKNNFLVHAAKWGLIGAVYRRNISRSNTRSYTEEQQTSALMRLPLPPCLSYFHIVMGSTRFVGQDLARISSSLRKGFCFCLPLAKHNWKLLPHRAQDFHINWKETNWSIALLTAMDPRASGTQWAIKFELAIS